MELSPLSLHILEETTLEQLSTFLMTSDLGRNAWVAITELDITTLFILVDQFHFILN